MWSFNSLKTRICGLVVAMGLLSSMASASTITNLIQVTGPVAGVFTLEYQVNFYGANTISAVGAHPDLFAVLDIHGLMGAKFVSIVGPDSDWAVAFPWQTTVWNFGSPQIFGGDSAALENVEVTKVAGNDVVNLTGSKMILGALYIYSTIGDVVPGVCVGGYERGTDGTGPELTNSDPTAVPIPVPAAMWTGMALLGLIGAAKLRKSL
ncbi:MAG: hypothetical protein NTU53_02075 [Planctomycetota bacterium]|nr:hypothetical protein [Planctomycetota bacterium]